MVAVAVRGGHHGGRVGPGAGLGEGETRGDAVAGADAGDVAFLLLLRTDRLDHLADHVVDRDGDRGRGTGAGDFGHGDGKGDGARLGTAAGRRNVQSHEAKLSEFFQVRDEGGTVPLPIEPGRHRREFGGGEGTRRIADEPLFFGELKKHGGDSVDGI